MSLQAPTESHSIYRTRPEDIARIQAAVRRNQYNLSLQRRCDIMQHMRACDSLPSDALKELGLEGLGVNYMNLNAVQLDTGQSRPQAGTWMLRGQQPRIPAVDLDPDGKPASSPSHEEQCPAGASASILSLFGWLCSRGTRNDVIALTIADLHRDRHDLETRGARELLIRAVLFWQVIRCISAVFMDAIGKRIVQLAPLLKLFG